MARPGAEIIESIEVGDGSTWDILRAERYYAITYNQEPISIRITKGSMTGNGFIYKKMTYTNLGSARLQCQRLNHRFNSDKFEVMMIN